jgi:XTP/dITP diphosphohydrolase
LSEEAGILKRDSPTLYFGTTNTHKFSEAKSILGTLNIKLKRLNEKGIEIQSEQLDAIADYAVKSLAQRSNSPVIVEDAGLFIDSLNGFPGPYSSFVHKTIGLEGILRLMDGKRRRSATFLSVVSFCGQGLGPLTFRGAVRGKITIKTEGTKGFGFDPIFMPEKGNGKTFAKMTLDEKNLLSHRARSLRRFAQWYLSTRVLMGESPDSHECVRACQTRKCARQHSA